ncbi:hypothetical protein GQ55_2G244700 [Panicum hallii var. hallii]|uniref:Uncharacterized protein n=1 Tax=Panicum hallii var. hallii TaxID=1504633 RepID=A0A2T7ERY6_9POAL|nr:hypothetical protein GQ55_2G244700 [Panicum hallii var. hallii]
MQPPSPSSGDEAPRRSVARRARLRIRASSNQRRKIRARRDGSRARGRRGAHAVPGCRPRRRGCSSLRVATGCCSSRGRRACSISGAAVGCCSSGGRWACSSSGAPAGCGGRARARGHRRGAAARGPAGVLELGGSGGVPQLGGQQACWSSGAASAGGAATPGRRGARARGW